MGQLTRSQVVSQALAMAGNSSLTTLANVWLNYGLRSLYKAWPWPWLYRRIAGVSLPAGTQSLLLGAGSGGVAIEIKSILDPISLYDSSYTARSKPRVRPAISNTLGDDESLNNPATNRGQPSEFKVRADSAVWGKWALIPTPVPDRDYLLAIDYVAQPADLDTSSGGDALVPIYPNDATLVQIVYAEALKYMNDPRYSSALEVKAKMAVDDRIHFGSTAGTNDTLMLDPSVFR